MRCGAWNVRLLSASVNVCKASLLRKNWNQCVGEVPPSRPAMQSKQDQPEHGGGTDNEDEHSVPGQRNKHYESLVVYHQPKTACHKAHNAAYTQLKSRPRPAGTWPEPGSSSASCSGARRPARTASAFPFPGSIRRRHSQSPRCTRRPHRRTGTR